MKVSLQLIPEQPAEELVAAAQAADQLGFYACYSADEIYHKDAWLLLVAASGQTESIRRAAIERLEARGLLAYASEQYGDVPASAEGSARPGTDARGTTAAVPGTEGSAPSGA
jgi:hypothetical protein